MKNSISKCLIFIFTLLVFAGCQPIEIDWLQLTTQSPDNNPADSPPTVADDPTETPPTTVISFPQSEGPLLLLQTDFSTYQILDPKANELYPVQLPAEIPSTTLAESLSPSGSQLLIPIDDQKVALFSIQSGTVESTYQLYRDSIRFQPALAAGLAQQSLPDLNFSEEELLKAVENASLASRSILQWFRSDHAFFFVSGDAETETHLYLYDRSYGESKKIESEPALVEDFWVGPDGNLLLLKKSYVFDPRAWQDDRYYLVNLENGTATMLTLPEDIHQPALSWFSANTVSITHQIELAGGNGFSLLDVDTLTIFPLIEGSFSSVLLWGNDLLVVQHDREEQRTLLSLRDLTGQTIFERDIQGLCFMRAQVDSTRVVFNCEQESLLLTKENLSAETFGKPVSLFSRAPDSATFLVIDQVGEAFLTTTKLLTKKPITLEELPAQMLWLPDSSGFLYRAHTRLFFYDLMTETSQLLISSEFFGDYRNLNTVWIAAN